MADTTKKADDIKSVIYAATNIYHGSLGGEVERRTNKVIPVYYDAGDVVDTTLFTKEEIAALLEAGALSRENPKARDLPPLSAEELASAGSQSTEPVKP